MSTPRRALVVIDVQREYFSGPLAIQYPPREDSLARILDALNLAEHAGIPIVLVEHENDSTAPVFAAGSEKQQLHPQLLQRVNPSWKRVAKRYASIFDGTDVTDWLRTHEIDTLTLTGYMTNNCVLATAAAGEPLGFGVEVLADATGAINLSNDVGIVPARQVHESLLTLLHSNFAAVTLTRDWGQALAAGTEVSKSNLLVSATGPSLPDRV